MKDIIRIDRNALILNKLSIAEYYFLELLSKKELFSKEDTEICGKLDYANMQDLGFVKIMDNAIVIRAKGRDLFADTKNNFFRFLNTFPIKTPDGRYLSPRKLEGVAVDKIKEKWNKLFKGNVTMENHVIRVLEAEVEFRRNRGELKFMNAVEAWLNMANYEKYEYLLEDEIAQNDSDNHELM
jgi:hypothetical protein